MQFGLSLSLWVSFGHLYLYFYVTWRFTFPERNFFFQRSYSVCILVLFLFLIFLFMPFFILTKVNYFFFCIKKILTCWFLILQLLLIILWFSCIPFIWRIYLVIKLKGWIANCRVYLSTVYQFSPHKGN